MPPSTPCPDDAQLAAFDRGDLPAEEIDRIADHLGSCPLCEARLQEREGEAISLFKTLRHGRSSPEPHSDSQRQEQSGLSKGADLAVGTTIAGRYKLVESIGEGGMGVVYMAQQVAPIRRLVAVKLIKEGMDTRQVLARFEAERQALALMDHPNIARVLDAGATATGRPYFVMELVRGVPITTFCDDHKLTTRDRLDLFNMACRAIQHAHQKGIIHRDIKPGNVLVARFDGKPVVKVIDFGIAKAVGQPLTDKTMVTNFGAVIGTLEYMSPEQASLDQLDIDTRSDVYALGVLLYELLTGTTPLERQRLGQAALYEMLRLVREQEPPKPSTRLSNSRTLASIAVCRGVDPAKLAPMVRGDLDWIAMRALEKDRSRRYETANGLARDVERFLNDEPVEATPPTARYRLSKFARRHRRPLLATAAAAALLVAATAVSTWAAIRAARAEASERAELRKSEARYALARDAIETFYTGASEDVLLREPQMKELRGKLLGSALEFYRKLQVESDRRDGATPTPEVQAAVAASYEKLAGVTFEVGDKQAALAGYERALPLRRALAAAVPKALAARQALAGLYHHLGVVHADIGTPESAADWHNQAATEYATAARQLGGTDQDQLSAVSERVNAGEALARTTQVETARATFDGAVADLRRLVQTRPTDPGLLRELAVGLTKAGYLRLNAMPRPVEAIPLVDEATAIYLRLAATEGDDIKLRQEWSLALHHAGTAREQIGPIETSLPFYAQAVTVLEPVLRRYPTLSVVRRSMADLRIGIGVTLAELPGRVRESLVEYDQADALLESLVEENPTVPLFRARLAATASSRGYSLARLNDTAAASSAYDRAIALRERLAREQPTVSMYRILLGEDYGQLGNVQRQAGRLVEASRLYRQAITTMGDLQGSSILDRVILASWLAGAAGLIDHDPTLATREARAIERDDLIRRALNLLREATDAGFRDPPSLTGDSNFAPLQDLPAYRLILRDMAFPDEPFGD